MFEHVYGEMILRRGCRCWVRLAAMCLQVCNLMARIGMEFANLP